MKALTTILILSFISFSCGSSKLGHQKISSSDFINDSCPNFRIEHHKSEASDKNDLLKVDLLPIFFDTRLKNPDNLDEAENKEPLRVLLRNVVVSTLSKHNINHTQHNFNSINSHDANNYKKSIRTSSFAFAHTHYAPKKYYTSSIENIGLEQFKLAFFFQIFPKLNKDYERIYIHILLYDTEKKKNTYYDYLIYEECSIKNIKVFESVLDKMVANFKTSNIAKNSE